MKKSLQDVGAQIVAVVATFTAVAMTVVLIGWIAQTSEPRFPSDVSEKDAELLYCTGTCADDLFSAQNGDANAQYSMGLHYRSRPYPRPEGFLWAEKWFRLAAEQGNADAQDALGDMYISGQIAEENEPKGPWWNLRESLGLVETRVNYEKANAWFLRAAEQGHKRSQYRLGHYYEEGLGVLQDDTEAERWYRLSAENGHEYAQFHLGSLYENGRGVTQDFEEAAKWYRLAVPYVLSARFNLALMHRDGRGVPKDRVVAHIYLGSLVKIGSNHARESKTELRALEKQMTTEQIDEAERRTRICMENRFLNCRQL